MNAVNSRTRELGIFEPGQQSVSRKAPHCASATVGSELKFSPRVFDTYSYDGWLNIHHDLLVLCAAIEYADRRWSRGTQGVRSFRVTVPVFELDSWKRAEASLKDALSLLTGDEWNFFFRQWQGPAISIARQRPLIGKEGKRYAIPFSDGLDSLCVEGLLDNGQDGLSVRVAYQNSHRQRGRRPFDRVPFRVSVDQREDSVRSRGFKFAAVSAIAAHIAGVSYIVLPESGQGALGPVLVRSIGNYPDYRNHPRFLRRMESFVRDLLGWSVAYEQPRLWHTKGETISEYLRLDHANPEEITRSRSCWQKRRNVGVDQTRRQCGLCAACLFRRMSLHAAGLVEPAQTYTVADLSVSQYRSALPKNADFIATSTLVDYGIAAVSSLDHLATLASSPDSFLGPYILELEGALPDQDVHAKLRRLLNRHAEEWNDFRLSFGEQSFINQWASGVLSG